MFSVLKLSIFDVFERKQEKKTSSCFCISGLLRQGKELKITHKGALTMGNFGFDNDTSYFMF